MIIINPDPVLPTIPPLQPSPPYYLKIYPQSLLAGNVWTCQYNLLYLRPGATLHVLLTSCMKCPSTPPPRYNNTSRSIFGQKPVSLFMSSLPVVGSVPAHLHLMVTTHLHNQYSARTRCHSPSVPDLHTSPPAPALSTSSSQFIIQLCAIRFYLQASGTLRVLSFLFLLITDTATLVHGVILPILNSVVKTFGVKPFPPGEAGIPV